MTTSKRFLSLFLCTSLLANNLLFGVDLHSFSEAEAQPTYCTKELTNNCVSVASELPKKQTAIQKSPGGVPTMQFAQRRPSPLLAINKSVGVASVGDFSFTDNLLPDQVQDVAVGEIVEYELEIEILEEGAPGEVQNLVINDDIPLGMGVVGVNLTTGAPETIRVSLDCDGRLPNPFFGAGFGPGTFSVVNPTGSMGLSGQDLQIQSAFPLSAIPDGRPSNNTLCLYYNTAVLSTPQTDLSAASPKSQLLSNAVEANYEHNSLQYTVAGTSADVRQREPEVQLTIDAQPNPSQIGDTVVVTLSMQHTAASRANAFQNEVTFVVPQELTVNTAFSADGLDNTGSGADDETAAVSFFNPSNNTFRWNFANTQETKWDELQYQAAQTITVQFEAQVNGGTNAIPLVADLQYSPYLQSINANSGINSVVPNTVPASAFVPLAVQASANLVLGLPAPQRIDKTIVSNGSTAPQQWNTNNPDYTIGDTVRSRIEFTLPEGTYPNLTITDQTDFLEFAQFGPATFDTTMQPNFAAFFPVFNSATNVPRSDQFNADGINDTFEVQLGALNILPGMGEQTFVFEYIGRIIDIPTNLSNGVGRVNTATLNYTGLLPANQPIATAAIDVIEPDLSVSIQANTTDASLGEVVTYTVTVQNNGTSPAYNVELNNTVPSQFILNTAFLTDSLDNTGDGSTTESGPHSFFVPAGQTFNWTQPSTQNPQFTQLNPGQAITLQYQVQVDPINFNFVGIISNSVTATATSMPGFNLFARSYAANNTFALGVNQPDIAIEKTNQLAIDADANNIISAGDTVEYTLLVTNFGDTEGTYILVADIIPANVSNLSLVTSLGGLPGTVVDLSIPAPGGANGKGELIFDGLTLAPYPMFNSQVSIVYTVTVDSTVTTGETIVNNAAVSAAIEGGTGDTDQSILIVGAAAQFSDLTTSTKQVLDQDGDNVIDRGDVLQYTVEIINTGTSDAIGVQLFDDMPAHTSGFAITQLPTSGLLVPGPAPAGANSTGRLEINNITVPAGGSQTVVYEVVVDQVLPEFTPIANTMTIRQTGRPDVTDSVTVYTEVDSISIYKGLYGGTNMVYAGEILAYEVVLTNTGSTPSLQGLLLQDVIPAGGRYIANSIEMDFNGVVTPLTDLLDTDNADYSGTVTNTLSFVAPAVAQGQSVTFRYEVRAPRVQTVQQYVNTVTALDPHFLTPIVQGGRTISDTQSVIVLPAPGDFIQLQKTVLNPPATIVPGQVLDYEIIIVNNYNITPNPFPFVDIVDLLPAELQYMPTTLRQDIGGGQLVRLSDAADVDAADYDVTNPGNITYRIQNFGFGDTATFRFSARVDRAISVTQQVRNRVRVGDSQGDWIRNGRGNALQANSNITVFVDTTGTGGGTGGTGGGTGGGGGGGVPGGGGGIAVGSGSVWDDPAPVEPKGPRYTLNLSVSGELKDRINRDIDDVSKTVVLPNTGSVSDQLAQAYGAESVFADMSFNDEHYMALVALNSQGVLRTQQNQAMPNTPATYADLLSMIMIGQSKGIDTNFDASFDKAYKYKKDAEELALQLNVSGIKELQKTNQPVPFSVALTVLLNTFEKNPRIKGFEYYKEAAEYRNLLTDDLKILEADSTITRAQWAEILFRMLQTNDEQTEVYTQTLGFSAQVAGIQDYQMERSMLSENSVWVSTLNNGGAFYKDLQSMNQNTILFAHSSQYEWHETEDGPVFAAIAKSMKQGDTFTVQENGTEKTYTVMERRVVAETDVASLQNVPEATQVTIFTCDLTDLSKRVVLYASEV